MCYDTDKLFRELNTITAFGRLELEAGAGML